MFQFFSSSYIYQLFKISWKWFRSNCTWPDTVTFSGLQLFRRWGYSGYDKLW